MDGSQASRPSRPSRSRPSRLVGTALRCYPARWRRRHGDEAAELAALLISDGTPAGSIAWSYLAGAARAWVTPPPGRRVSTVACALLAAACSLAVSAGLLASTLPARASSTGSSSASRAHCLSGPVSPVPEVVPVRDHPQAILWEARHDRSC